MDTKRIRGKKKSMRFKDYIKESIIDIPRRTYAPKVFDDANTENPKIKPSVKELIDKQIQEFEKEYPVLRTGLIGSILTKRYRNDADLDINVLFDVPKEKQEEERVRLSKKYLSASNPDNIQGKLIPGSEHPINYYFITDNQTYKDQEDKADAVFDIENNKFIKRPEPFEFDVNVYINDFNKKVQEIDVVKGELKRDIIDYNELKELTPNDVLNLQEKIKDKLEEIEDSLEDIVKIGDTVDAERRAAFDKDMSPDEIRKYGIKNRLPKNVVYKMLEKYHYIKFYKYCKKILEDGVVTDKEIDDLEIHEQKGKTVAFTFGRFNPPTIGHEKLIKKVSSVPADDFRVYLSRSVDKNKNPLSPREKLSYMKKMFPNYAGKIEINPTNMVLDIATDLYKKGFSNIKMVVGSDRVNEFKNILKRYNDVKSRHGYYNFDSIDVISAGERDPDAEGAVGMSASKMRAAAEKGDIKSFSKGLPTSFSDKEMLFKSVRKGMNLAASYANHFMGYQFKPVVSLEEFEQQQIRDLYVREMIFNVGDKVNYLKEDFNGKVVRRGTNYVVLEDNNNNLHKCWIWDCIPVAANREVEVREYNLDVDYGFEAVSTVEEDLDRLPQDRDVKKKKGTQPKKYYKGLSKDVKSKRASHFKSQDTTKPGYKPAPGDKDAKTKPSIHTQKYKKMFGELKKELSDACWTGYKQVGMKMKNGKQVPNCVPEAYEIGADYANHTKEITPGQTPNAKPVDAKKRGYPTDNVNKKDIEEWSLSNDTIDKYKERYKEEWRTKLDEVVKKMMEKIDVEF
jgi:predicted nucleotidyltransferase